jgi:hypothetical protein
MGLYYNRTQSPVPVTLSGGRSILIPAKGRETLHGEDESAPALLQALSSQKVVRLPDAFATKGVGVVQAAPAVAVSSEPEAPPAAEETPAALPLTNISPTPVALVSEDAPAEPELNIEPKFEIAPSDDGSSSSGVVYATPAEQSTRADGPRRERRK